MLSLKARIIAILDTSKDAKSSEFEADLILFHAFRAQNPRIHNLSELRIQNPESTPEIEADAIRLAEARAQGLPLQHLIGNQFFFEHEYFVNDSTLIPRPETEILVSETIQWLEKKFGDEPFSFLELGLGSGVISGEVLARFKNARGVASEINPLAIALARQNLERILGASFDERFQIMEPGDESTGFEIFLDKGPFDVVLSNPPYLSVKDEIEMEVIKHEPHLALFPKTNGDQENPNHFYESFLIHAKQLLKPDGISFFEIPHERALTLLHSFQNAGFSNSRLINDLTGRHRVLQAGF
jgi:release factor glutamine methyltransferase